MKKFSGSGAARFSHAGAKLFLPKGAWKFLKACALASALIFVCADAASAQQEATRGGVASNLTRVVVNGESVVQERPDTAILTVAVITQARAALDAQRENAARTEAVVRAVRQSAGTGAEVETSGYSLQPQYTYREGQPPLIQSYTAQNSVTVTTGALERVGAIIDAASAAGANNVSGLAFTLRRDKPARDRALSEATRAAVSKAQVVAQALNGRVVRIVEVQEASASVRPPVPLYETAVRARGVAADAVQTPVETGTLDIRSQVTLVAEITTNQ
jgi:uncharacterized protein